MQFRFTHTQRLIAFRNEPTLAAIAGCAIITTVAAIALTLTSRTSDATSNLQTLSSAPRVAGTAATRISRVAEHTVQVPTRTAPATVEGPAKAVTTALEAKYASSEAKLDAIVASISRSGAAPDELNNDGLEFSESLQKRHLITDWHCFSAACYYLVSNSNSEDLTQQLLGARKGTNAEHYLLAITPEAPPRKLAVLLNYKPNTGRHR